MRVVKASGRTAQWRAAIYSPSPQSIGICRDAAIAAQGRVLADIRIGEKENAVPARKQHGVGTISAGPSRHTQRLVAGSRPIFRVFGVEG